MDVSDQEPAGPPVLAVEGLTKRYGKKEAVSNLCFNVRQGELVGLLGPNGAGKSTTLRMIAGCLAPSAGCVRITGCNTQEQPAFAKSRIGYLPEVPPLYPDMTASEYLHFAQDLKNSFPGSRTEDISAWMESLVRNLEIEKVMNVLIRNLSKGYRQRVGIAAAMAGRPALLLLDEPASGLDPRQAVELRSLLRRISSYMAIIVSSHGLYEISSLCTRIIIMNKGRIAADGQPGELAKMGGDRIKTETEEYRNLELTTNLEDVFISLTDEDES